MTDLNALRGADGLAAFRANIAFDNRTYINDGILLKVRNIYVFKMIICYAASAVLAYILAVAGEQACTSFVGQNMGAKKYDRIGKIVGTSVMVTGVAMIVYSLIVGINGRFFLGLFTSEKSVVEYGMSYINVVIFP